MWWAVWCLPLLVASACYVSCAVPCATPAYFCLGVLCAHGIQGIARQLTTATAPVAQRMRAWKTVYHGLCTVVFLPVLLWFEPATVLQAHPHIPWLHAAFGIQFGLWTCMSAMDPLVNDFFNAQQLQYATHHAVTLLLIAIASVMHLEHTGAVVMACMDVTDVPFSLMKIARTAQWPRWVASWLERTFVFTWVVFRLGIFTQLIVIPVLKLAPAAGPEIQCAAVLLVVLQGLNAFWTRQIIAAILEKQRGRA